MLLSARVANVLLLSLKERGRVFVTRPMSVSLSIHVHNLKTTHFVSLDYEFFSTCFLVVVPFILFLP